MQGPPDDPASPEALVDSFPDFVAVGWYDQYGIHYFEGQEPDDGGAEDLSFELRDDR